MLSILIAEQSLDLSDDFSVSLNLKSPIFNDVGDYSFPFKVPSSKGKEATFDNQAHVSEKPLNSE